jgi:hypothetical protein
MSYHITTGMGYILNIRVISENVMIITQLSLMITRTSHDYRYFPIPHLYHCL